MEEGPLCAHAPNIPGLMGDYPVAIQSFLFYPRGDGATLRREAEELSHLWEKGDLYAPSLPNYSQG